MSVPNFSNFFIDWFLSIDLMFVLMLKNDIVIVVLMIGI